MHEPAMEPEEFELFLSVLKRFVRERLMPAEVSVIASNDVPEDIQYEMRGMGLFGLTIPAEYGGIGVNASEEVEIAMTLSYAIPAFRTLVAMNWGVGSQGLVADGTPEQKAEWLPRLAAGEHGIFGLTEPDSGSDSAALKTRAVRDGDDYVLNGTKRFITNSPRASLMTIMARTHEGKLPGNAHVTAFLVPRNTPGVTIGRPDRKMGQRGALTADVVLQDVRVPASSILGGVEGNGFKTAMKVLDRGRIGVAAACIGLARRCLDEGMQYALQRNAFGEPIANFQLVQSMLADSKVEIYAAECMVRDAARKLDDGQRISIEASCCKLFASEMAFRVADRAVQIHGGAGYMQDSAIEHLFRDSRVFRIYEGTSQIQQLVIARAMMKSFNPTP